MASDSMPELVSALKEAVTLLHACGQRQWAGWLEKDRQLIAGGDFHGVTHLLQAFGGMGSLTDLVVEPESRDVELKRLTNQIYELATTMRRQQDRREAI
jgi:hypothetical protein